MLKLYQNLAIITPDNRQASNKKLANLLLARSFSQAIIG